MVVLAESLIGGTKSRYPSAGRAQRRSGSVLDALHAVAVVDSEKGHMFRFRHIRSTNWEARDNCILEFKS